MLIAFNKPFNVLCQFTDSSQPPRATLAGFGLPRTAFGGTQLTGSLTEARLTAPLWCPACDRAP